MLLFLRSLVELNLLWRQDLPPEQRRCQPYHVRPKAHLLQHLVLDQLALHGSPSDCWCYLDESFVGDIKGIASGTKDPRTIETRIGQKLTLLAGVEAERRRRRQLRAVRRGL